MKFLVDAHLPPSLCELLRAAGHDAVHTIDLPKGNQTADREINDVSLREERVVVSKDTDFYYSHLLSRVPRKLLLVRTGNISVREIREVFQRHLPAIILALESNTLVELDKSAIRIVI